MEMFEVSSTPCGFRDAFPEDKEIAGDCHRSAIALTGGRSHFYNGRNSVSSWEHSDLPKSLQLRQQLIQQDIG